MTRLYHYFFPLLAFITIPLAALAQNPNAGPANLVLTHVLSLLNVVIQILLTLAIVVFGWGVVRLIFLAGDPQKIKDAKKIILWGLIGIFVLASLYGIMDFIIRYLGIPDDSPIVAPKFQ